MAVVPGKDGEAGNAALDHLVNRACLHGRAGGDLADRLLWLAAAAETLGNAVESGDANSTIVGAMQLESEWTRLRPVLEQHKRSLASRGALV